MNKRPVNTLAFSLVEILAVISVILIIFTFAVIGFKNFASFQQYNQATGDVTFILNQARLAARSAVGDESHGVKFGTSSLTRFIGDTYVSGDANNEVTNYSLVTLTQELSDGGDVVVFGKLTGLPSATGTVTVSGVQFSASTTVEIAGTGVIQ